MLNGKTFLLYTKLFGITSEMKPLKHILSNALFISHDFAQGNLDFFWWIFSLSIISNKIVDNNYKQWEKKLMTTYYFEHTYCGHKF